MKHFISWIISLTLLITLSSYNRTYSGPKYNINAWKNFEKYTDFLGKKYQLSVLTVGVGRGVIDIDKTDFASNFASHQQLTLGQARIFAQTLMSEMLNKMYQDPVYYAYYLGREPNKYKDPKETPLYFMGFKVSYWDADIYPLKPPYIAKIIATGEEIKYYYVDPETYILQEPIVEPFVYSP